MKRTTKRAKSILVVVAGAVVIGLMTFSLRVVAPVAAAVEVSWRRASASDDERAAVLAAVQAFFDVMSRGDTAAASEVLTADGRFYSVGPDGTVRSTAHASFAKQIGDRGTRLLERAWDSEVSVHGPIAQVWTPYDFHINGAFSHCGVDAFTLVKSDGRWRVAGIAYTVEPEGCAPSPLGPPQ